MLIVKISSATLFYEKNNYFSKDFWLFFKQKTTINKKICYLRIWELSGYQATLFRKRKQFGAANANGENMPREVGAGMIYHCGRSGQTQIKLIKFFIHKFK